MIKRFVNYMMLFTLTMAVGCDPENGVAVKGIDLVKKTLSLEVGETEFLEYVITPSDATNRDVTWKSKHPTIANVSSSGEVEAISPGEAKITVTTKDGNKSATCIITVIERNETEKSSECDILSFIVDGIVWSISNSTITHIYPKGTNLSNITPIIFISDKATISPVSGVVQDFSNEKQITYTVTAEDGTTKKYTAWATMNSTFDETLLYGRWKPTSGTQMIFRYDSNHTGVAWNPSDGMTEAEGQPFTWKLDNSELEQRHWIEIIGEYGIIKIYSVTELTKTTLKYKDGFGSYSFIKDDEPQAANVYMVGDEKDVQSRYFAKFWKNVETQNLGYASQAWAHSVYVSGNDVYVACEEINAQGKRVAKLWKNGQGTNLSNGRDDNDVAKSVFVSGSDVYVAGSEVNEQGQTVATIWKNGNATILSNGRQANCVFVSGANVYVAGVGNNEYEKTVAKVWINGVVTDLTDGIFNAEARSVYVFGNDVYVAGCEQTTNGIYIAKIWKNGNVLYTLTNNYGNAYSVFVSGGNVFAAGYEYGGTNVQNAKVWKNGEATNLTNTETSYGGEAYSVYVIGSDVYVAGFQYNAQGNYDAAIWKNGKNFRTFPGNIKSRGHSIFVVEKK